MKLISYVRGKEKRFGLWINDKAYDVAEAGKNISPFPTTMKEFLEESDRHMPSLRKLHKEIEAHPEVYEAIPNPVLCSPVPHPTSCRDGYAFRQHVETMRKNRGAEMAKEFDQFPIFYFTNHNAIVGPGDVVCEEDHFNKLDLELEVAIVIGKRGMNIPASKADDYIFGYTIMNDFSARTLQTEEMVLSLGPAKGKDFATALGPWLVTKDELDSKKISGAEGDRYDLRMTAFHNGKQISDGNMNQMNWTFAQILERVSYGAEIFPGDVIGSGTVGTGCYAELNSTAARIAKETGKEFTPTWLEPGDTIELEVEGLGRLKNKMIKRQGTFSILAKKKNV
ncbi:MAG: fumarylacetoacetate hydrolase family protein [Bdellovibrionota bacterium]